MLHRAGLIGDVHAEDAHLSTALEFFRHQNVDALLCTGDVVDGPGDVDRCCQLLRDNQVITVRGNHDVWMETHTLRQLTDAHVVEELSRDAREFIADLPATLVLETAVGSLLLCHGVGEDNMWFLRTAADDPSGIDTESALHAIRDWPHRFMVGGHTHKPMVRGLGDLTVINPGTLKHDQDPGVALVDFDARVVQFFAFAADLELVDELPLPVMSPG